MLQRLLPLKDEAPSQGEDGTKEKSAPEDRHDFIGREKIAGIEVHIASIANCAKDEARYQSDSWFVCHAEHMPEQSLVPLYLQKLVSVTQRTIRQEAQQRARLHQDHIDREKTSTVAIALLSEEDVLHTAYLGNSIIWVFVKDAKTGEVTEYPVRKNSDLRKPIVMEEGTRGITPPVRRSISLVATYGSRRVDGTPEVGTYDLKHLRKNEDDRMFICICTDGLEDFLGEGVIKKHLDTVSKVIDSKRNRAGIACKWTAFNTEEVLKDNATALIAEVTNSHGKIALGVADGSGRENILPFAFTANAVLFLDTPVSEHNKIFRSAMSR